jgi:hypothetical protein
MPEHMSRTGELSRSRQQVDRAGIALARATNDSNRAAAIFDRMRQPYVQASEEHEREGDQFEPVC